MRQLFNSILEKFVTDLTCRSPTGPQSLAAPAKVSFTNLSVASPVFWSTKHSFTDVVPTSIPSMYFEVPDPADFLPPERCRTNLLGVGEYDVDVILASPVKKIYILDLWNETNSESYKATIQLYRRCCFKELSF